MSDGSSRRGAHWNGSSCTLCTRFIEWFSFTSDLFGTPSLLYNVPWSPRDTVLIALVIALIATVLLPSPLSLCNRHCHCQTVPSLCHHHCHCAIAIATVPSPLSLCYCHCHCAIAITTVLLPSPLCFCHCHCAIATVLLPSPLPLCHHCSIATAVLLPLPSPLSDCALTIAITLLFTGWIPLSLPSRVPPLHHLVPTQTVRVER